jgi:hypothetical protein
MLLSNSLSVQRVPIDSLLPSEMSVRRHPEKQLAKIRKSVEMFGQVTPILVTPKFQIIDLELVWHAMMAIRATHVDVIVVADKSRAEIKALRLMLNRSAQDALWDDEGLRATFQDLTDLNFDLEYTGFDPIEIDHHLNLDLPQANVEENASDIPPVEAEATSSRGTIWALGKHRIGCGDATDLAFVNQVLEGRRAHASLIDSPRNIPVRAFVSGEGLNKHREFVAGPGELSFEGFFAFLRDSLIVVRHCCLPTALVFSFIDWQHVMEMTVAGHTCEMQLYQIITWVKSNAGMGGIYRNASEFVVVFSVGKDAPLKHVELGRRGRSRTNVWHYPSIRTFGKHRDNLLKLHPNVKPVAMIADALRDVTRRGEIVLDSFLGSGSTLIAAHETGRICCGVELDPLYVDVAIRRWQNITGREATNLETGETFNRSAQRLLGSPPGVK